MRVRSNITLEAEWTEEDDKNQRNRVEKSIRFLFFCHRGQQKSQKHRPHITITVSEIEKEHSSRKRRRLFATAIGGTL